MKPVTASSFFDSDHRPEYLTNGKSCNNTGGTHPAATTKREEKPWFRINLNGKYHIRAVVVKPRGSKFIMVIAAIRDKSSRHNF